MRYVNIVAALFFMNTATFVASAQTDDALLASLRQAGLSVHAYQLMMQQVQSSHYTKDAVAITDYTLASDRPRFFLINLKTKTFKVFPVSHGMNSGGDKTVSFSNENGSNQSSLGFIKTVPHDGMWKPSLGLEGLSCSNTNLESRYIILHAAEYSSQTFENQNGFWGRSLGCLALPKEDIGTAIDSLGAGALILNYQDQLWDDQKNGVLRQPLTSTQRSQCSHLQQKLPGQTSPIPAPTDWEMKENAVGTAAFAQIKGRYIRAPTATVNAPSVR